MFIVVTNKSYIRTYNFNSTSTCTTLIDMPIVYAQDYAKHYLNRFERYTLSKNINPILFIRTQIPNANEPAGTMFPRLRLIAARRIEGQISVPF